MNKIQHAPRPTGATLAALHAVRGDLSSVLDFGDDELTEFFLYGTGHRVSELRRALTESVPLRARMRRLKLNLLFRPGPEVVELLEQSIDHLQMKSALPEGRSSRRKPGGEEGSVARSSSESLRIVALSSLNGRCEVPKPVLIADHHFRTNTKSRESALKVAANHCLMVPIAQPPARPSSGNFTREQISHSGDALDSSGL